MTSFLRPLEGVLISVVLAQALACGEPAAPASTARTYTVRALVLSLDPPAGPVAEIKVHHEAIDDFANAKGDVIGMNAMTMPFPLASPDLAKDLAPKDVIQMTFSLDWQANRPLEVVAIEKLPQETQLEFRKANPAGG